MNPLKDRYAQCTNGNEQDAPQYIAYQCPYEQSFCLADDGNAYGHPQQGPKYAREQNAQADHSILVQVSVHFRLGFAQVPFAPFAAHISPDPLTQEIYYCGARG